MKNIQESLLGEFRAVEGSSYFNSPLLYKENGFLKGIGRKLIKDLAKDYSKYNDDGTWNKDEASEEDLLGRLPI